MNIHLKIERLKMSKRGKFIVIDGTDGAGKSTMTSFLINHLSSKGLNVVRSREPGGTPFSEKIRETILWGSLNSDEKIDPQTELLLMFAARNQHLKQKVIPELNKGNWVICERFTSSTFAYQGYARGVGTDQVLKMDKEYCEIKPDLTVIFDVPPEISRERTKKRGDLDHFEKEEIDFFTKVREGYHLYSQTCREKCDIIDASQSMDEVKKDLLDSLKTNLSNQPNNKGPSIL